MNQRWLSREKFDILSWRPAIQAQISCRSRSLQFAETVAAQESGKWSHHCGLGEGEAQGVGWLGLLLPVAEVPSSGFRLRMLILLLLFFASLSVARFLARTACSHVSLGREHGGAVQRQFEAIVIFALAQPRRGAGTERSEEILRCPGLTSSGCRGRFHRPAFGSSVRTSSTASNSTTGATPLACVHDSGSRAALSGVDALYFVLQACSKN